MTTNPWPDFYIVGAPKAGTTSLYEYLGRHPGVFAPSQKELWFFGSDLEVRRRVRRSERAFLELFRDAPPGSMRGTAFVWYLFSRRAAEEIHAVRPDARIIVMLRNPVAALPALHSEFVYDGNEDIEDFAEALDAEQDRCSGRRIPPEAHFPAGLCYRATARYTEQVQRYVERFGRGQVHVALLDDFVEDAPRACGEVLAFLGLPVVPSLVFPHSNPNKRSRSALARRLLAAPPMPLRRAARLAVPARLRRYVYRRAVALNAAKTAREVMSPALRRRLQREFEPEIAELEILLGRPLTAWREPS